MSAQGEGSQRGDYQGNRSLSGNVPMSHAHTGHPSIQYAPYDANHVYISPSMNAEGQTLQYPSQSFDFGTSNYRHGPSSQQQFYAPPPSLQPQDHTYSVDNGEAMAHYHGYRGVQQEHIASDGYNNPWAHVGPQNDGVPFLQRDTTDPEPSATSSVMRRVATEAVRDAAERRRVNPHRFFCQHCDGRFTAMHNYKRHLGAHNDERPFGCYCGSAFTTKSDLKRHQLKSKKHGDDSRLSTIGE